MNDAGNQRYAHLFDDQGMTSVQVGCNNPPQTFITHKRIPYSYHTAVLRFTWGRALPSPGGK